MGTVDSERWWLFEIFLSVLKSRKLSEEALALSLEGHEKRVLSRLRKGSLDVRDKQRSLGLWQHSVRGQYQDATVCAKPRDFVCLRVGPQGGIRQTSLQSHLLNAAVIKADPLRPKRHGVQPQVGTPAHHPCLGPCPHPLPCLLPVYRGCVSGSLGHSNP